MKLHIAGAELVDAQGRVVRLPGVSAFSLFARFLMTNGWDALCVPILDEWRAIAKEAGYTGPIILRVFRYAAAPNAFAIDPWGYHMTSAAEFTRKCGERGFYVDWTSGDAQIVLPERDGDRGRNMHNNLFVASIVGCDNAFFQTRNEPFKNGGIDGEVPPNWGGLLRHSGYYNTGKPEDWDLSQDLDIRDFHQPRTGGTPYPKWSYDMFATAATVAMFQPQRPLFHEEPIGADEVASESRCNIPAMFGIMGLVIAMCSAVYFHSTDGIPCNSLRPIQRACAVAFFKGIVGGLACTSV